MSEEIRKIEREISLLYSKKAKEIKKEYKQYIGKCFKVTGSDLYIYILGIEDGNMLTLEIHNNDMYRAYRKHSDMIFQNPEFICTKEDFLERVTALCTMIKEQIEKGVVPHE